MNHRELFQKWTYQYSASAKKKFDNLEGKFLPVFVELK